MVKMVKYMFCDSRYGSSHILRTTRICTSLVKYILRILHISHARINRDSMVCMFCDEDDDDDEDDDGEKANTPDGSLRVSIRYYCLTFLINPPN